MERVQHDEAPVTPPELVRDAITAELEKILFSKTFRGATRSSSFLRYVVEQTLRGQGDHLKEYSVGIEVFGRNQSFDPRLDSIVRVEATKLRSKLATYYETEGFEDPIRIEFPKGAYLPTFHDIPTPRERGSDAPKEAPLGVLLLRSNRLAWFFATAFATVVLALAFGVRRSPTAGEPVRFEFGLPPKAGFNSATGNIAISPNGTQIAFTAVGADGVARIYVRSLDSLELRVLAGTEGVSNILFWSNDERILGFGSGGKLRKIDISGGPPQTICDCPGAVGGGFWTADNRIVFSIALRGIYQVSALGGKPSPLTIVDKSREENLHVHPFPLPDGKHFLYVRSSVGDAGGVYVGSLQVRPEEQAATRLLSDQTSTVYAPSVSGSNGNLLFVRNGTLMAQPFNPSSLKLSDKPIPIAENVATYGRAGVFSVSSTGVLAYRNASLVYPQLTWYDRRGRVIGTAGGRRLYISVALSPGDRYVATAVHVDATNVTTADVWMLDLDHDANTRITLEPTLNNYPVWSPDGSRIAFASNRDGTSDLYLKASNGSAGAKLLLKSNHTKLPTDWSRDGRYLLYSEIDPQTQSDIWILPLTGGHTPIRFVQTAFYEGQGQFSPNGKWIAYTSDESGRREVYVQPSPFPTAENRRWLISSGGGTQPRWGRDGKELFYVAGDQTVMAAEVTTNSEFSAGLAKPLFDAPFAYAFSNGSVPAFRWDVAADGQRFLIDALPKESTPSQVNVVLNWQASAKQR